MTDRRVRIEGLEVRSANRLVSRLTYGARPSTGWCETVSAFACATANDTGMLTRDEGAGSLDVNEALAHVQSQL